MKECNLIQDYIMKVSIQLESSGLSWIQFLHNQRYYSPRLWSNLLQCSLQRLKENILVAISLKLLAWMLSVEKRNWTMGAFLKARISQNQQKGFGTHLKDISSFINRCKNWKFEKIVVREKFGKYSRMFVFGLLEPSYLLSELWLRLM